MQTAGQRHGAGAAQVRAGWLAGLTSVADAVRGFGARRAHG
eukprot:COSAG01_NODE_63860_length_278_cov_1.145251_1_plen_40_part_01